MNETLCKLRERALTDAEFRATLLKTREADDPLLALCEFSTAHGFPLTLGDVISDG